MTRRAAAVLVIAVALAGCLGSSPSDPGDASTPDADQAARMEATLSASPTRGPVPFNVSFTVDATVDNASWRLDFDDGNATTGDSVPATVAHTYERPGSYTASVDVTFSNGSTRTARRTVIVQPPPPPDPVRRRWNASATAGLAHPERVSPQPLPDGAPSHAEIAKRAYDNDGNGTVVLGYEVNLSERHRVAAGAAVAAPIHPRAPVPDYDLYLFAPNGSLVDSSHNNGTIEQVRTGNVTGGTWLVLVAFWAGADLPQAAPANVTTVFAAG